MSQLLPDDQVCEAYRQTRQAVLDLLAQIPESSAELIVPACPEWTVQQTAAHLVGVPEDLLAGRMEGVASDEWTNAQVQRHAGESLDELRAALDATVTPFDAMLPAIPHPSNSQLVMDALTHEIDLPRSTRASHRRVFPCDFGGQGLVAQHDRTSRSGVVR